MSKDLNERNIAVLVLKDSDPYSWRGAKKAFTSLTMWEAKGLEWKLLQEVEGLGLFEHVTRYEDPLTYNLKPAYELSLYGAWFARHEKESVMAKEFVDVPDSRMGGGNEWAGDRHPARSYGDATS